MNARFTHTTHPPGRWLAALASSLVLWGIAYAHAPAPAWLLGLQASDANLNSSEAVSLPPIGRSRFNQLLLNDLDNAMVLRQLAADYAGPALASASRPAAQDNGQNARTVATNTGPNTRPIAQEQPGAWQDFAWSQELAE